MTTRSTVAMLRITLPRGTVERRSVAPTPRDATCYEDIRERLHSRSCVDVPTPSRPHLDSLWPNNEAAE